MLDTEKYPQCFTSQGQFDDWTRQARIAHEQASPCGDCSKKYKHSMLQAGRCDVKVVRRDFTYTVAKAKKEVLPA
jgi:hypothetical protein